MSAKSRPAEVLDQGIKQSLRFSSLHPSLDEKLFTSHKSTYSNPHHVRLLEPQKLRSTR